EVELLAEIKGSLLVSSGCKEFMNRGRDALMTHLFVVGAVGQQEMFIVAQERSCIRAAFVPDQNTPTTGFQDASEFAPRTFTIEPVSGLRRGNKIHRCRGQGRLFGGT